MADSATIVAASLDSSQLETSINNLVKTVAEKTKAMADNFTSEVARMEQAVKNLGNIKIDSGGASDGGSSRRTKSLSEEIAKAKEVTMSYDQMQAALQKIAKDNGGLKDIRTFNKDELQSYIDLLRKLQAEYVRVNTQEGGGAKSDQIKRDMAELEKIIQGYQTILKNVEMINSRQGTIDVKKWTQDIGAVDDRYKKLVRWYTVLEKEDQRRIANEEKANQKRLAELEKEQNARQKMIESARKAEEKYQNAVLKTAFNKIVDLPSNNIDQMRTKLERLQTILANIRELGILSPKEIANAETEIGKLRENIQQIEKFEKERIAAEKQFIVEQAKEIEQTETLEGRVRGLAKAAREYFKANNGDVLSTSAYGKGLTIYGENDPRSRGLSIEQQIRNALTEEKAAREGVSQSVQQQQKETQNLNQAQKQESENIKKSFKDYDSLRQAIASVLGVRSENVRLQGVEISSINDLSNRLKELRGVYNQLGTQDRHSERGKELISQIQNVERQMDRARKELSRPIDLKSALGTSEKTLDDIAYKMQRLASYRSGLNVETQQNEIRTVNQEYDRLKKKMDEVMQKNQQMIGSNNALGRSWNYMKNRLAFYFTVGAGTQFIKNLIEVRAQYEMNERALGILINSAERGTQIFNELSQMALVSPYTLIELSAAAKQLTAYDIAARDVVDTTRRLADMASAVGVPIERLTYALGQIKAYGYLNSRDARMFANAGIPLVKQLSDYYTELEGKMVSTADVYDRMKKKAIDYNSVMSVITKMTDEGGKFFDFQAKMADTLKVRLANLTLAWNNMLNDMGKETQGVLTWGIGALRQLFLHWKKLDELIKDAAWILGLRTGFMLCFYAAIKFTNAVGTSTRQMALSSVVGTRLAGVLRTLGQSIATIVKSPLTWWSLLALAAWDIFDAFVNANKATEDFNKSLRDSAKTTYEDLKKFAEQYKNIRDSLYKTETIGNLGSKETTVTTPQDIEEGEAKKVWEAMREQIELSSHASDEYISKLLSIENVSERLRQGFQILDDIQTVSAALKEIGEDGIKVTQGWAAWWNAWQGADGLIGNVKDLQKEIQRLKDTGQDPNDKFTKVIDKDYATALERFRKDLKVTTDSVIDFINLNGWSGDTGKIDEVFKQVTDRLATQGNLDPQTAFTLQKDVEIARAKAAKEALEIRIADEKKALAASSDEISRQQIQKNLETLEQQKRDFDKFNGENRAYWNDFTKYIKERHISELTAAYNSMTDHGKKAMDFQSEEWQKYVHDWANGYEKSHNLATDSVFNRLRNWINDANTWSVFIKMTISNEDEKPLVKQLEELDKTADDAWKKMQRLDKRIAQLRKKGAHEIESEVSGSVLDLTKTSQDDKELTKAIKERAQAQADYDKAIANGAESKKADAAASKAQKAAESELSKAIKDELQLIEKARSSYKELTKEGATHSDAVEKSVSGYEKSVANINAVLNKYGIGLDLSKFAGITNPHDLLKMLQSQLSALVGKAKPADLQALEVEIKKVNLDVEKYDLTMITKGLNNELDRLKDEYELAVSLDADPELGNMFADWMGIDVNDLPRTAQEYANEASKVLNSELKKLGANIELPNLLSITDDDMRAFEQNEILTQQQLELVKKRVEESRGFYKKEVDDRIKGWNTLLEKYSEYEAKINKIQNDATRERVAFAQQFGSDKERSTALKLQTQILAATDPNEKQQLVQQLQELVKSIAGNDKTKINLVTSINNSEQQGLAKASFEEFQKTPEWLIATGDLSTLTDRALGGLIRRIEEYKKKAKNLDPKQIKNLNNALKNLRKQQREGNPFLQIANAIDEAKERAAELKPEMDSVMSDILALEKEIGDNDATEEQAKQLETLKERWKDLAAQGDVSANEVVGAINSSIAAASQAISMFTDMADALGGQHMTEATQTIKDVTGVLEKAGQGAAIGAQIGQGWGALIGGVAGGLAGLITNFADRWSGNKAITDSIKDSERAVKRLENAYRELEFAAENAYGTAVAGANQAMKANKELQLVELKRQLALEQSRRSKNRDEDKIIDLTGQIIDLENEISKATSDTLNNLLGISSHGDFFESMISDMISAFKNGEDAMKVFEEKWAEMIDNMIMKTIVSQVLQNWVDSLEDGAQKILDKFTAEPSKAVADLRNQMTDLYSQDAGDISEWIYDNDREAFKKILDSLGVTTPNFGNGLLGEGFRSAWFENAWDSGLAQKIADAYKGMLGGRMDTLSKNLDKASLDATEDLIDYYSMAGEDFKENYLGVILERIKENWTFGQDSQKDLSQLQQGIQSISESTANALEGYMNSVSQQVYYHSTLLEQIRDAIMGTNSDIQLGVQGQMLLQLQQSYQVQMSIQGILEGALTPSGQGFRVELIS